MSPVVDPAFVGAGNEEGLKLWRIEKMDVVEQPKADGKFHEGDCYLLLATTRCGSALTHAAHFWIGKESSQDEQGIAAFKAVELDDSLGAHCAQYREAQGRESPLFLSYFKSTAIQYLPGGVASGFNKVDDSFTTRLLHVKGKRVVRSSEAPCTANSLNTGDVFILDAGRKLYLWNGPHANMYEKSQGVQFMQRIKDSERAGRATIYFMDDDPENSDFWDALGGYMEVTAEGEPDEVVERVSPHAIKLYQVSDESGSMVTKHVEAPGGRLSGRMLGTDDVYILDVGTELFVWVGRGSSVEEKRSSVPYAAKFIEENGRDVAMPVSRLSQGYETLNFKGYFAKWDPVPVPSWDDVPSSSRSPGLVASPETPSLDPVTLATKMKVEAKSEEEDHVDDGSGKLEIWRVEKFELVPWPEDKYGQLYGGDCYVMLYTYLVGNREMYILYYWQGRTSSTDEVGASAILAKEMDDKLGGAATQVRVVQGKEPRHMRSLFKGKLVVHSGGVASGFRNSDEADSYDVDGVSLFHVKGSCHDNTYAVQVPETASSLNSGDSFVLLTPSEVVTWVGRSCTPDEATVAESIAEMLLEHGGVSGRTLPVVAEGSESESFWEPLGGRAEYPEASEGVEVQQEARLFQVSNVTGTLTVHEVCNFDQSDLCADDIMLLDTFTSVSVWVGPTANEAEQKAAMSVAEEYVKTATDGRSPNSPILLVNSGSEPPMFTQHFHGWDPSLSTSNTFVDPYEAKLMAAKEAEARGEEEVSEAPGTITMDDVDKVAEEPPAQEREAGAADPTAKGVTVPYEELKGYGKDIPGVNPSCREQYLSDAEFLEVFGMSKEEFAGQSKWKQVAAKKEKELF